MKKLKSLLLCSAVAAFAGFTTSCEKEQGCMDESALNYDPDAEEDDGSCVYDDDSGVIKKIGEITEDETWTSDNVYRLDGRVIITNNATLTIEPGTIIKGAPGQGAFASALIISRDGMIKAEGTAQEPIIFTSVFDDIQPGESVSPNMDPLNNGLWGGVIILGDAPISAANNVLELQIEGIPTSEQNGLYGGSNATDNSGIFSYVSIRHGGSNIGAGNEINGLTLGGVGSGTTINNVEVVANQDDGIEWFGGNVNVENALIWNCGDDGLDTDQDWIGTCSDFIIVTPRGGSAFELDGPEGSNARGPVHTFNNGIVYAGPDIDHLVDWDANTNAGLTNIYFYGFDPSYEAIADDPSTPNEDEEFNPIETFGGSQPSASNNWEYTLASGGASAADIFTNVPSAALTEVPQNGNSVGPNVSSFSWTWASQSGALSGIGL